MTEHDSGENRIIDEESARNDATNRGRPPPGPRTEFLLIASTLVGTGMVALWSWWGWHGEVGAAVLHLTIVYGAAGAAGAVAVRPLSRCRLRRRQGRVPPGVPPRRRRTRTATPTGRTRRQLPPREAGVPDRGRRRGRRAAILINPSKDRSVRPPRPRGLRPPGASARQDLDGRERRRAAHPDAYPATTKEPRAEKGQDEKLGLSGGGQGGGRRRCGFGCASRRHAAPARSLTLADHRDIKDPGPGPTAGGAAGGVELRLRSRTRTRGIG